MAKAKVAKKAKKAAKRQTGPNPDHKRDFGQLLDDAVLGVMQKKK